jgi:hypothetical protein
MVSYKSQITTLDGRPTLIMPFQVPDPNTKSFPLIDPRADSGKYIMGLFESGPKANGARVHAVSAWTSPKELLEAISKASGVDVGFKGVKPDEIQGILGWPDFVVNELKETMLLVGNYSYYGKGEEQNQGKHDEWLLPGTRTVGLEEAVESVGPWKF